MDWRWLMGGLIYPSLPYSAPSFPPLYRHSRESGNPPPAVSVRRGWPGWWLGAYLPHPTLSRWERAGGWRRFSGWRGWRLGTALE